MASAEMRQKLESVGFVVVGSDPQAYSGFVTSGNRQVGPGRQGVGRPHGLIDSCGIVFRRSAAPACAADLAFAARIAQQQRTIMDSPLAQPFPPAHPARASGSSDSGCAHSATSPPSWPGWPISTGCCSTASTRPTRCRCAAVAGAAIQRQRGGWGGRRGMTRSRSSGCWISASTTC